MNFVGWPAIYSVFGEIARVASQKLLTADEIDLENEIALSNFTVLARLIVDNTHNNENVLAGIRNAVAPYVSNTRVTYSVPELRATGPDSGDPYDCASMWGDSARLIHLSALAGAIAGPYGVFGTPQNGQVINGLYCGGSYIGMPALPIYQAAPGVVDMHIYPCVGQSPGCGVNPRVRKSAEISYTKFKNFLNWRNPGATAVIGETWPTQAACGESGPPNAASDNVGGYNDSTLDTHSRVVMRPWHYLASGCFPQIQLLNPPYTP